MCTVLALAGGAAWVALRPTDVPPGRLDFTDIPGYMRRLARSRSPVAVRIRAELASGAADLARERAALRHDGVPVVPGDLQRASPPTAQDAAPDYLKLTSLLQSRPLPRAANEVLVSLAGAAQPSPEELAAAAAVLNSRKDVMALVHQAADKPACVFVRPWRLGPSVLFPEYARMRQAARLVSAESYLLARQGRYREAASGLSRAMRIADHAGQDPCLIAYLVGVACDQTALRGFENVLYAAGPNAEAADAVRAAVERSRPRLSLASAMGGEVASLVPVSCQMVRQAPAASLAQLTAITGSPASGYPAPVTAPQGLLQRLLPATKPRYGPAEQQFVRSLVDASEARMLRRLHQIIRDTRQSLPERMAGPRPEPHLDPQHDPVDILPALFLPAFSQLDRRQTQVRAHENAVIAAAAVLAYRARRGSWPDSLRLATDRVPQDPFTGRALRYRPENDGFAVWSVGPTGRYDGGEPGAAPPATETCVRYPAPIVRGKQHQTRTRRKPVQPPNPGALGAPDLFIQGPMSGIRQARQVVVRDAAAFRALWRQHAGPAGSPVPPVDFSKRSVVAVFAGPRPTGGYRVEIGAVDRTNGSAVVHASVTPPPPGAITTQAFTYPFAMRSVEKLPANVRFEVSAPPRQPG